MYKNGRYLTLSGLFNLNLFFKETIHSGLRMRPNIFVKLQPSLIVQSKSVRLSFPPVPRRKSNPHQNQPERSLQQTCNHKIKTRWSAPDGQPQSQGWSPTIQNIPEGRVLQTWNLALELTNKIRTRWSALMVSHDCKDGQSPSKIYQKEVYNRLGIWHLDLTHKIKTRW